MAVFLRDQPGLGRVGEVAVTWANCGQLVPQCTEFEGGSKCRIMDASIESEMSRGGSDIAAFSATDSSAEPVANA